MTTSLSRLVLGAAAVLGVGCAGDNHVETDPMKADRLTPVRNELIQFVTMRPPGSRSAVLDRRVVVTDPPVAVELSRSGDIDAVGELIELLRDEQRAWAALVVLAAMTGRDAKTVDVYATTPDEWWKTAGSDAHASWSKWFTASRDQLAWDAERSMFTQRE